MLRLTVHLQFGVALDSSSISDALVSQMTVTYPVLKRQPLQTPDLSC